MLLLTTGLLAYLHEPEVSLDLADPPAEWARELYEHHLPALSWASARVALGGRRELVAEALAPAFASLEAADPPPVFPRILRELERRMTRPGFDPKAVRALFDALNQAAARSGLPLYADVQLERVHPEKGKWAIWIQTFRVVAVRRAATPKGEHAVLWLDRLGDPGIREERLGWKKGHEPHAVVLLDVVRRHWREDLAPHLVEGPAGRRARHLYAQLGHALRADLERSIGGSLTEELDCRARFGASLWLEDEGEVPPEARPCWGRTRALEPVIVEALARRVEQHELQHAIDARELEPPPVLQAGCAREETCSPAEVTAEVSAVLAEVARGPAPRLALAHFVSLGAELGGSRAVAARSILELMSSEGEDAVRLLQRPGPELSLRARRAYRRLFEREVVEVMVREVARARPPTAPHTPPSAGSGLTSRVGVTTVDR